MNPKLLELVVETIILSEGENLLNDDGVDVNVVSKISRRVRELVYPSQQKIDDDVRAWLLKKFQSWLQTWDDLDPHEYPEEFQHTIHHLRFGNELTRDELLDVLFHLWQISQGERNIGDIIPDSHGSPSIDFLLHLEFDDPQQLESSNREEIAKQVVDILNSHEAGGFGSSVSVRDDDGACVSISICDLNGKQIATGTFFDHV